MKFSPFLKKLSTVNRINTSIFSYKYALVCNSIPNSIKQGLSSDLNHPEINVEVARKDHINYLNSLKKHGLKLIEIDANEKYPDCVFVEDTAVVIGKKIFVTNLKAKTRMGEILAVRAALEKFIKSQSDGKYEMGSIKNENEAFVDGGDCCYTGRELIVGISNRTNHKAAEELAEYFNDIPVITVDVISVLHLKSALSMVNYDTILISKSAAGRAIKEQIKVKSKFGNHYKFIEVDCNEAANVLFINEKLFYSESFKHLFESRDEFKNIEKYSLENNEFSKIDGCLTCRSILI